LNAEHQPLVRAGIAWLAQEARTRFSRDFLSLSEAEHVAILQPLSDEVDRRQREARRRHFRTGAGGAAVYYAAITDRTPPTPSASAVRPALPSPAGDQDLPVRLFRLIKNLTADGYYTSRAGLLEELGYSGNTALARFPSCTVPEH
jgi:hypothetical protein